MSGWLCFDVWLLAAIPGLPDRPSALADATERALQQAGKAARAGN
jgi:hypothetical protein